MSRQGTQWQSDSKRQQAGQANRRDECLLTITRILPQESQLDAGTLFKFPSSPSHKLRHDSRIVNTGWCGDAAVSWPRPPYSRNSPTSDVRLDGCEEAGGICTRAHFIDTQEAQSDEAPATLPNLHWNDTEVTGT